MIWTQHSALSSAVFLDAFLAFPFCSILPAVVVLQSSSVTPEDCFLSLFLFLLISYIFVLVFLPFPPPFLLVSLVFSPTVLLYAVSSSNPPALFPLADF